MNYIRPRKQDARQSVLKPIQRPYVPDLSPMPHWVRPARDERPKPDDTWLRTFVAPPPGWKPEIDERGYRGEWEWVIASEPFTDMLRVIAARIWFKARSALVANIAEARVWVEALPL